MYQAEDELSKGKENFNFFFFKKEKLFNPFFRNTYNFTA